MQADGDVLASLPWDPDGAGPAASQLVLAGAFTLAGAIGVNRIVAWDPVLSTWSRFGQGFDGPVNAVAAMPNGDLVAAGEFTFSGGVAVNRIARWNGTAWAPLGAGFTANWALLPISVKALAVMPNGDLIAAGAFAASGSTPLACVARWNGSTWSALGSGVNDEVRALTVAGNTLVAGGRFTSAGGVATNFAARWNGSSWAAMGMLPATFGTSSVNALRTFTNGNVMAGGLFKILPNRDDGVAVWNGSSWSAPGFNPPTNIAAIAGTSLTDMVVAGAPGSVTISRFDGVNWYAIGLGPAKTLQWLPSGELFAAGSPLLVTGSASSQERAALWNGIPSSWRFLGNGLNNAVRAILPLPTGGFVAGGDFTIAGPQSTSPALHVAQWNGTAWARLGAGLNGDVKALVRMPNGDIVAGGYFTASGTTPVNYIARWNGTSWSPLGTGLDAQVECLIVRPDGSLVAGGSFIVAGGVLANCIARWDGTSWSSLAGGITPGGYVGSLANLPDGSLVASGNFTSVGGVSAQRIARWNGSTWSGLGAGLVGEARSMTVLPNGDLIAGGGFTMAGGVPAQNVARWNGTSWAPLGPGIDHLVYAVYSLPDGDVLAGGIFTSAGGTAVNHVARWNGSNWSPLAAPDVDYVVEDFAMLSDGDLVLGGLFRNAGGRGASFVARLHTACPAAASWYAGGCASSGGANLLSADSLPWVDGTFRATGIGLPATAIVVSLTSLTSIVPGAVPLSLALPQADANCYLLVAPDIVQASVTVTGTLTTSLFLPNTPPLVGVSFYHQMVPIEVDATGAWTHVTATNALRLTAGMF